MQICTSVNHCEYIVQVFLPCVRSHPFVHVTFFLSSAVCFDASTLRAVLCTRYVSYYSTRFLLRITGFQRRQRTDHIMYTKALKKAQRESVETTIRRRRLLFAGAVQRAHNERLTRRVMYGTMAGGETPGPSRPENNWAQCLVDDLRVFRATEGFTESFLLVFGVETMFLPKAAKKGGK